MIDFCCDELQQHINSEASITYFPKFREFGIAINDSGSSIELIRYCPWCGSRFPASLREAWFDKIEKLDVKDTDSTDIPSEMGSDEWWRLETDMQTQ